MEEKYITTKEIIAKYGFNSHVDRDYHKAKIKKIDCDYTHKIWLFDRKKVEEIAEARYLRKTNKKNNYKRRPDVIRGTKSKLKKVIDEKMYIKLRNAWFGMMRRCYADDRPDYHHYRDFNITICDEWLNSFDEFALWALNNGVKVGLSLDRINNDKGYSPNNCRWTNQITQGNNTSLNTSIRYNGEEKTIAEFAREYGIKYHTLYNRVVVRKWDIEKALTTKVRVLKNKE